ncbi:hypothetical protein [Streptomyces naphthomycinicus]|uniref:hypothetical protein n=1 Tax=Streptomyces naphthomycinicus TaxID=2872625 RepID=UPI001CED198C|nr:hypothetical protein [Streptomyces sp. TML10]
MGTLPNMENSSSSEEHAHDCAKRLSALERRLDEVERRQRNDRIAQWIRTGVSSIFSGLLS